MDLKKKDIANLLTLSEETIDTLIQENKIPHYKLAGEYRFNRQEIEDWICKEMASQRRDIPFGEGATVGGPWQQFGLYRAISKGCVIENKHALTKEELLFETIHEVESLLSFAPDVVFSLFQERENLMSTGLSHGIAVPHTREFLLNGLFDAVVVVYPKEPLDWGALDNEKVHTLFFLFACDDRRHLNLLAKIAHFASQEEHLKFLKSKPCKEDLLDKIKKWEDSLSRESPQLFV